MRKNLCMLLLIILSGSLAAQTENTRNRNASKVVFEGLPTTIRLAAQMTTTIRLPEPVNSVILGDSNLFQAEYSPNEPLLVFARPIGSAMVQTNLVISTTRGRQFILLLKSLGVSPGETESGADLLVICRAAGLNFIEETFPSALISETVGLESAANPPRLTRLNSARAPESGTGLALDEIVNRQRQQKVGKLYGDRIRVGIGQVTESGSQLIVPFSVMSSKFESIELVPPQVQLAGQDKTGIFRHTRWTTVQQLPLHQYEMSRRRIEPGGRADGVVVFERPPIKQSTEGLFLQIADSAQIDKPTLAPINFKQAKFMENDHE